MDAHQVNLLFGFNPIRRGGLNLLNRGIARRQAALQQLQIRARPMDPDVAVQSGSSGIESQLARIYGILYRCNDNPTRGAVARIALNLH